MSKLKMFGMMALAACALIAVSCQKTTEVTYDDDAIDQELAGSMAVDEGGSAAIITEMPGIVEGSNTAPSSAPVFGAVVITASNVTITGERDRSVVYYHSSGTVDSNYAVDVTNALVQTVVERTFDGTRHSGSTTITNSYTVTPQGTTELYVATNWVVKGTSAVSRTSLWKRYDYNVSMNATHTFNVTISRSTGDFVSGTATTSASGSVAGRSYSRTGTWTFGSGGTATLTTPNGSITVNVTTGAVD